MVCLSYNTLDKGNPSKSAIVSQNGEKRIHISLDKVKPCPFLSSDNLCLIYEVRPDGCRLYPINTTCGREDVECKGFDEFIKF